MALEVKHKENCSRRNGIREVSIDFGKIDLVMEECTECRGRSGGSWVDKATGKELYGKDQRTSFQWG